VKVEQVNSRFDTGKSNWTRRATSKRAALFSQPSIPAGRNSYPALGADVVHLVVGALADPLAAPQFTADFGVRVAHGADRKEVGDDHERHVISAINCLQPSIDGVRKRQIRNLKENWNLIERNGTTPFATLLATVLLGCYSYYFDCYTC
jgi:hypothetical protein